MTPTIIENTNDSKSGVMSLMAKIAEHLNVNINDFCGGPLHGEHTSANTAEGSAGAEALGLNPDYSTTCIFHQNRDNKKFGFVEYTYFITFDGSKRAAIVRRAA